MTDEPNGEAGRAVPATNFNVADAAEMLWILVANVSGGDWTQQSQEWQAAAARYRDYYFAALEAAVGAPPNQLELLASALKKVLPPALLADVIAHCDPLTPFLAALRTEATVGAGPRPQEPIRIGQSADEAFEASNREEPPAC